MSHLNARGIKKSKDSVRLTLSFGEYSALKFRLKKIVITLGSYTSHHCIFDLHISQIYPLFDSQSLVMILPVEMFSKTLIRLISFLLVSFINFFPFFTEYVEILSPYFSLNKEFQFNIFFGIYHSYKSRKKFNIISWKT